MKRMFVHSTNGVKAPDRGRTNGQRVAALAAKVDHLAELRALIRKATKEERRLTGEILQGLQGFGVSSLAGHKAFALLETRTTLRPDPQLFVQAVGGAAWPALVVSVMAARKLMGDQELAEISELVSAPVLRIESLSPAAEA